MVSSASDRLAHELDSISELRTCMKLHTAELLKKREQIAFLQNLIEEKQRQCKQLKENHEKRIRALSRQARRQRGRSEVRENASSITLPSRSQSVSSSPSGTPLSDSRSKLGNATVATSLQLSAEIIKKKRNELKDSLDFQSLGEAVGPLSESMEAFAENPEEIVSFFTKLLQQKMEEICSVRNNMNEYSARASASDAPEEYFALEEKLAKVLLARGR
eukprot:TRINITY_DN6250_c0_g1_i2.p1 TRINITY_DN6250_c0_g1~~TRINITY_DN6250_c0_g1_i2.p1  ORF type:complete len:243 (+),score=46.05 TRINITY_DN6250_c0_g1_i2:76-729(+)